MSSLRSRVERLEGRGGKGGAITPYQKGEPWQTTYRRARILYEQRDLTGFWNNWHRINLNDQKLAWDLWIKENPTLPEQEVLTDVGLDWLYEKEMLRENTRERLKGQIAGLQCNIFHDLSRGIDELLKPVKSIAVLRITFEWFIRYWIGDDKIDEPLRRLELCRDSKPAGALTEETASKLIRAYYSTVKDPSVCPSPDTWEYETTSDKYPGITPEFRQKCAEEAALVLDYLNQAI